MQRLLTLYTCVITDASPSGRVVMNASVLFVMCTLDNLLKLKNFM